MNLEDDRLKNILQFFKAIFGIRHLDKMNFRTRLKKETISMISFFDRHSGFFIFLATFILAIITLFYLRETHLSRKLIEEDIYIRSLPVMVCNTPLNEKDKDRVNTEIKITNNGATAFDENMAIFWTDDNRLFFEDRAIVIIEGMKVPVYRYKFNHPANSWRKLTLDFSEIKKKIKNLNEFYVIIILKYKVPLSRKYLFEKFGYKYEPKNDIGRWENIPIFKVEELYVKAKNFGSVIYFL